jgi:hypothetical protein
MCFAFSTQIRLDNIYKSLGPAKLKSQKTDCARTLKFKRKNIPTKGKEQELKRSQVIA